MLKKTMKTALALALSLLLALGTLTACTVTWDSGKTDDPAAPAQSTSDGSEDLENLTIDTYITLDDDNTTVNGDGAAFADGTVTITAAGTYALTGTLANGQIVVNTDEDAKVKLLLDGVNIHCETDAAIYVENSPKETKILLAEGSENTLTDGTQTTDEDRADAVIYSKDDLEISGTGTLTVDGSYKRGIFSKNDLQISGGVLNVTSPDDALRGKDSVEISGGVLNLTTTESGDAVRTSNEEKGDLTVSGGVITIQSVRDGLQAVGNLTVSGGTLNITTGGGYNESLAKSGDARGNFDGGFGGFGNFSRSGDAAESGAESSGGTVSAKGVKADGSIAISGGTLTLDCLDDAIHGNADVTISGGTLNIRTNDDGIHADTALTISGGDVKIEQSYEGLEGNTITVSSGEVDVTAADDGVNAAPVDSQSDLEFFANNANFGANAAPGDAGDAAPPELPSTGDMTPPDGENSTPPDAPIGETNMTPPTGDANAQNGFPGRGGRGAQGEQNAQGGQGGFGFNRRGQTDGSNGGNRMGGGMEYDASCVITISGGTLTINADGDGIDSNGDVHMTGGDVTVFGPTNSGNGALDYAGSFEMTGGTLLAVGANGMAQGISKGLASVTTTVSISAGSKVELLDASGNTLTSFTAPKTAGHLVFANEALKSGSTYTLRVDGSTANVTAK